MSRYRESDHYGQPPIKVPSEPDLFAFPAPSVGRPGSEAAADALGTPAGRVRRESQAIRLLRLIASRDSGYTSDELDEATNLGSGSICARVDDLRVLGLLDSSETVFRKTRRGKSASVHFATMKGRERVRQSA